MIISKTFLKVKDFRQMIVKQRNYEKKSKN